MRPSAAPGVARTSISKTEPAGSRETETGNLHPAEARRRTSQLVARSAELGHRMRRSDAHRVVAAYADRFDVAADGWNLWLRHRFDPTAAAVTANVSGGGRGV